MESIVRPTHKTPHPSAVATWKAALVALSLLAGCSPALEPGPEATAHIFQGARGEPENRLVALSALPPALPLNAEVTLSARGGTLLVSNDPEYLTDAALLPAALYRDELTGSFRVFYHHANSTRAKLTLATALTNTRSAPVLLFRRGLGGGTNVYPDVAGQAALNGYLGTRHDVRYLATLAPGESTLVVAHPAGPGETVSALEEFVAVTPPQGEGAASPALVQSLRAAPFGQDVEGMNQLGLPARFGLAPVTVTVLAYRGRAPKEPHALSVMPGTPLKPVAGTPYYLLKRGTFPFSDRYAEVPLTSDTAHMLTVDSAVSGPFSRAMPGEYFLGRNAVDGKHGYQNGNYGVLYNLRFHLANDTPLGLPYAFLMQPSGGLGHYALQAEGDAATSPFVSYENAWWFYRTLVVGLDSVSLRVSLAGGAFGPQTFFFVPYPLFER